jgi:DNA polymerase type B, organellar and viral/Zinc-finger of C2H2 type
MELEQLVKEKLNYYDIRGPISVELQFEGSDSSISRPRIFKSASSFSGQHMFQWIESVLHSNETVKIEDVRIRIIPVMPEGVNLHGGGSGTNSRWAGIPKHLKNYGIVMNNGTEEQVPPDAPCGILAFLLVYNFEYYSGDYEQWVVDASFHGTLIGLKDNFMQNEDFMKLVALPDYDDLRIIIWSIDKRVELSVAGSKWKCSESDKGVEDPNTYHIIRDSYSTPKHYYSVKYIKHNYLRPNQNQKVCFLCFTKVDKKKFDSHVCTDLSVFPCGICKRSFSTRSGLEDHKSQQSTGWSCEVCKKTTFNGRVCFDRHLTYNCEREVVKERCSKCTRLYPVSEQQQHKEFFCNDYGCCYFCGFRYVLMKDRKNHYCYLKRQSRFTNMIEEVKGKTKFTSHWFYDFETTGIEQEESETKIHEVMAWEMGLMIIDLSVEIHIKDQNYISKMKSKLADCNIDVLKEVEVFEEDGTIFFRGKTIDSFILTCTKIVLYKDKNYSVKPVFWAHNGGKFDAKFIHDYYANVRNYDMRASSAVAVRNETGPVLDSDGNVVWEVLSYVKKNGRPPSHSYRAILSGTRLLELGSENVKFRDSYAHHPTALRNLTKTFSLDCSVKKGEFPYPLLCTENWGKIFPSIPDLKYYGVDSMTTSRREEVLKWYGEQDKTKPWNFDNELWSYLHADVIVGKKAMEAYHQMAMQLHDKIHLKYPEFDEKFLSPLDYITAPSWALGMYKTFFMPEKTLAILKNEEYENIRGKAMRGGRTDKRANAIKADPEKMKIVYVDFKSLYPSVMKTSVHGTHFPVGAPKKVYFGRINNAELIDNMEDKTGFLCIDGYYTEYVTHPTLPTLGSGTEGTDLKLMFDLLPKKKEIYGWPEILEAIETDGFQVTKVHYGYLFDKGYNLFEGYVDLLFEVKDEAEEQGNKGLRSLAKLLLNSLWGKLGQRSQPIKEWIECIERRDYLIGRMERDEIELLSLFHKDDNKVYIEYREKEDFHISSTTAPQVAAFVSMWGRIMSHRKILSVFGQQCFYGDTDSALVGLKKLENGDFEPVPWMGNKLGDLTDEIPAMVPHMKKPWIDELIIAAPKTYTFKVIDLDNAEIQPFYKVVCKGFEPSFENRQVMNFQNMKSLVYTQYGLKEFLNGKRGHEDDDTEIDEIEAIKGNPRTMFRTRMVPEGLRPEEIRISKTITGKYTKGVIHPHDPRLIAPIHTSMNKKLNKKLCPSVETIFSNPEKFFK